MLQESIWKSKQNIPSFPRLESDTKTDVLIIGGGLAGLLAARAMNQAGADYLLIEADTVCGGVTQNTTAKITSQHGLIYSKLIKSHGTDAARMYFEAHEAALEEYRKLCKNLSCDFEEKDSYIYSIDQPQKLEQEVRALEKLGIPHAYTENVPLPFSTAGAIRFRCQAQFHPLKFAAGIAKNLNIREHTRAIAFEGNTVHTNGGKIRASNIIVATHFPILNKHGAYFLKMYQERSYVLALEHGPQLNGMYRNAEADGMSFRSYKDYLLLGGGSHRTGKQSSGWAQLESAAQIYYPNADIKFRWATQDCMTLDQMPYIGRYGKHTANLYVSTGFNKWGMTSSMLGAILLRDLIQGRENPWAELFLPSRSMLHRQLLFNAAEATANLLTPTKPRCPHLGCALKWNRQERSWDCPCHGSRFDEHGILLDNPATGDLNKP